VSFYSSYIFLLKTFPRHVPCLSTGIALHFSSSTSSFSYGKIISFSIVSSSRASSFLYLTVILSIFSSGFLEFFSDNSSTSVWTLSSVSLTFLPCQLFFYFQGYLIRIFHYPHFHHVDRILDFISQAINIPGNFFFVILPMSFSYVHPIKLFSVLFH